MDVFEAIKNRRSIRKYRSDFISEECIRKILDSAKWAPSAGNLQPWEFIVVTDKNVKRHLSEAALEQPFIEEAPVIIVICTNEERSARIYGTRGRHFYCLLDAAAAVQNILLTAYALGLGTCWVGAFDDIKVAAVLKLPSGVRTIAIVPLGYADETPKPPSRFEERVQLNSY